MLGWTRNGVRNSDPFYTNCMGRSKRSVLELIDMMQIMRIGLDAGLGPVQKDKSTTAGLYTLYKRCQGLEATQ